MSSFQAVSPHSPSHLFVQGSNATGPRKLLPHSFKQASREGKQDLMEIPRCAHRIGRGFTPGKSLLSLAWKPSFLWLSRLLTWLAGPQLSPRNWKPLALLAWQLRRTEQPPA